MGKPRKGGKSSARVWIITVFILSFGLSMLMSWSSSAALANASILVAALTVLLLVLFGIVADMIGLAVASADQAPFVAMAAKKVKGAKRALWLTKNADRVSSICNDVAGDICGIVSGSAGTVLALRIVEMAGLGSSFFISILVSSVTASLTVGGKALCKRIAIVKSKEIVGFVGKCLAVFSKT